MYQFGLKVTKNDIFYLLANKLTNTMMNCNDMVIKVLGKLEGKDALIASRVCGEWKKTLEKQTEKFIIKVYLEKLEKLVEIYSDCEAKIILAKGSEAELLQQKTDAEKAVNDFFQQRNKNYDKKLYIKAIKAIVRYDLEYYIDEYGLSYYPNWVFSESFVKKFNEMKKQL
jgi:phage pi2 protein 07